MAVGIGGATNASKKESTRHPDINSRKAPPWRSGQEEPQTQARKRIIIAHPEHYRYRAPISAVMDTPSRAEGHVASFSEVNALTRSRKNAAL